MALYLLRLMLEPRVNLAAIAPRRAQTRLSSFQNRHIAATLSKMQSRRQSSKAAADHDDADALVAAKRRGSNPFPRSFGIKATREPVCFRFDKIGHDCPIAHSDQSEAVSLLLSAPGRRDYRLARRSAQVRRSIGARSSLDNVLQRSPLDILHSKVFGIIQRL